MDNKILILIDDIEILLKQDKRFHLSDDHNFRNKIKELAKSNKLNNDPIDITPIVNLVKLNQKKECEINIQQTKKVYNIDSLKHIIAKLAMLNNKVDNIID
jgi:hypothetical protein